MMKTKRFSILGCIFKLLILMLISIGSLIILTLYSFKSANLTLLLSKKSNNIVTENKSIVTVKNHNLFDSIISVTFDFEGGFQNHTTDVANYNSLGQCIGTNHGISAIALERYYGYPVTENDVLNLTKDIAKEIYRVNFWNEIQGEKIKNNRLAHLIFDAYIANPTTCKIMVSMTLKNFGININKFTDDVVNSINSCNPIEFYNIFWEYRRQNFESLREKYPQFITGWLNRLNKLK